MGYTRENLIDKPLHQRRLTLKKDKSDHDYAHDSHCTSKPLVQNRRLSLFGIARVRGTSPAAYQRLISQDQFFAQLWTRIGTSLFLCPPALPAMRLLNVKTRMLEEYFDDAIYLHPYAILSHTWGPNEVLFSHIQEKGYKGGSKKVDGCIQQAVKDGYGYIWIDTCCIDKSSSAELSEAINSMFRWYEMSEVSYTYLEDVPDGLDPYVPGSAFRRVDGLREAGHFRSDQIHRIA